MSGAAQHLGGRAIAIALALVSVGALADRRATVPTPPTVTPIASGPTGRDCLPAAADPRLAFARLVDALIDRREAVREALAVGNGTCLHIRDYPAWDELAAELRRSAIAAACEPPSNPSDESQWPSDASDSSHFVLSPDPCAHLERAASTACIMRLREQAIEQARCCNLH